MLLIILFLLQSLLKVKLFRSFLILCIGVVLLIENELKDSLVQRGIPKKTKQTSEPEDHESKIN